MGPGSNPSWQEHSKPPTTLVQVPFPQGLPMEHSSVSERERERKREREREREEESDQERARNRESKVSRVIHTGTVTRSHAERQRLTLPQKPL